MKIVVLDGHVANPGDLSWEGLALLGDLTIHPRIPGNKEADIISAIADAEIIIVNKTPVTAGVLEACPNIRYIGVLATGYNVVDLAAASAKGIPITNIPAYCTDAVAQFVFALLLEICHNVGRHDSLVKEGAWSRSIDFSFLDSPQIELSGKTLGIIGYGRIGRAVAGIAAAIGMRVLVSTPHPGPSAEFVPLDELYSQSDVITLHCPLTPETEGMINKNAIEKMKDGVIIINASRGAVVNEQDLADALNTGKVYAAGIDVARVEPIREDNPLLTAKNCVITPHIAWASLESRRRMVGIAVKNVAAFLNGTPQNVVNL